MTKASICTIGDEILIGQIVDTNSSFIAQALESCGIKVSRMISIPDNREEIISTLSEELKKNDLVVVTGGLGPTKDDITKEALASLSGASKYVKNVQQEEIVHKILKSRGLDTLDINLNQAMVPDTCEVIPNKLGTAPVMAFHFPETKFGHKASLYSMPGVPYETETAFPDVLQNIKKNFSLNTISHRTLMTYGIAESALSKVLEPWEESLDKSLHLAYLPNRLTGVRLRISSYSEDDGNAGKLEEALSEIKERVAAYLYSESDDTLENTIARLLKGSGKTLSAAESCTGGEISHLITSIPGSSEYYLGSVTSYAIEIKEKVLGVPHETIETFGVVSSEVAVAMAEGVRKLTGSTYSVSTTGLAGPGGDGTNPEGTVWIGVSGPHGTLTERFEYKGNRTGNIERFSATALNLLRKYIQTD